MLDTVELRERFRVTDNTHTTIEFINNSITVYRNRDTAINMRGEYASYPQPWEGTHLDDHSRTQQILIALCSTANTARPGTTLYYDTVRTIVDRFVFFLATA